MSVDRKSNEIGLPAKIGLVILVIVALCLALKWWAIDYGQVPNKPKAAPSPRPRVVAIVEMKKRLHSPAHFAATIRAYGMQCQVKKYLAGIENARSSRRRSDIKPNGWRLRSGIRGQYHPCHWNARRSKKMKSYNRDIASLIRSLFDRISETPENAHEFINQVYSNLNKYGDKFFASPKQVKWLHRLGHIIKVADEKIAPTVSEEEMTPLQRLREKKRLLIKRAHRRRKKNEASGVILAKIIETRAGIVPEMTAQVKHAKSGGYSKSRRQIAKKG